MKRYCGYTLAELVITLAITALIVGLGLPSMHGWAERRRDELTLDRFQHLARFARNQAISRTQTVTLCPSANGHTCGNDWREPILVFTDSERNEILDPGDQLLRSAQLPTERCLDWRGSGSRQHLQFKPSGASNGIAGHLRFCDENTSPHKIVLALTGRTSRQDL